MLKPLLLTCSWFSAPYLSDVSGRYVVLEVTVSVLDSVPASQANLESESESESEGAWVVPWMV